MANPPNIDSTSWNIFQWVATSVIGAAIGAIGYIMRTGSKLTQHSTLLDTQKEMLDYVVEEVKEIKEKLSIRPTHEDISRLIHEMHDGIDSRLDELNLRLSRIDERIDTILTRK